jgi:hypothetical protein
MGTPSLVAARSRHWGEPQSAASWSNSGEAFQSLDQPDHRERIR